MVETFKTGLGFDKILMPTTAAVAQGHNFLELLIYHLLSKELLFLNNYEKPYFFE